MALIQTLLAFVVALGVLVTIHEYGHFWMARFFGIKVLRFSIGFGRPLIQWQDKLGTQFWVASIPLGGYVKMLDAREIDVPEELISQEFSQRPAAQRIAVYAAGPLVNLLFAVLIYWGLFFSGVQSLAPVIGQVNPGSPAYEAGLTSGDEIVRVDDKLVESWESVTYALVERIGDSGRVTLEVKPEGSDLTRITPLKLDQFMGGKEISSPLQELGLAPYEPTIEAVIAVVEPDGPADRAGLQAGDTIISAGGAPVKVWRDWADMIQVSPDQPLAVVVLRDGREYALEVTPKSFVLGGETVGRVGVQAQWPGFPDYMYREIRYSFLGSLQKAIERTLQLTQIVLKSIAKMVVGIISLENLSGPITIAQIAGDSVEYGIEPFLTFLAYLSVSLGVLNLLPIPVLDGGHILFACVEVLFGRPLSERVQHFGFAVGMALIATFMVIAFYNDIVRVLT